MSFFDNLSPNQIGAASMFGRGLINASHGGSYMGLLGQNERPQQQSPQPVPQNYVEQNYQPQANKYIAPEMGDNVGQIAQAIGQFESHGDYKSVGVPTHGGRALGKYQIMSANIPQWSKEALGYAVTPEQFLADPALQDKIAMHKMGEYHKKYGNINDVASMWFSGKPYHGNNARDALGTSVPQYISAVNKNYQSGQITPGNIDLSKKKAINNMDGTHSTVRTITAEIDGKTVLLPTIINGKIVSNKEAVQHFRKTGEHMGMFNSEQAANEYDKKIHRSMGWTGSKNVWQ